MLIGTMHVSYIYMQTTAATFGSFMLQAISHSITISSLFTLSDSISLINNVIHILIIIFFLFLEHRRSPLSFRW